MPRYATCPKVGRLSRQACNQPFVVEGRRIISQGITEVINLRVEQNPQLINEDAVHVASHHLIRPKRRFPEIHLNESYAHRPNIGRVATRSTSTFDKQLWCPKLIGRCFAATLRYSK